MTGVINVLYWLTGRLLRSIKLLSIILMIIVLLCTIYKFILFNNNNNNNNNNKEAKLENLSDFRISIPKNKPDLKLTALLKHELLHTTKKVFIKDVTVPAIKIYVVPNKKPIPCYNVHIFYYPWYGSPKFDQKYLHWNHKYLPHWDPQIAKGYPQYIHQPPDDIGSDFYPALGSYSSFDPSVIKDHMTQLSFSGVGVIMVSYYPPGQADDNGKDWQGIFRLLLKAAEEYKIKVGFHIEPYKNRDENTVKEDIHFIIKTYSMYPAFYKYTHKGKTLPLIYVYDSYHTKPEAWGKIFKAGPESIRDTEFDAHVIGLYVQQSDGHDLQRGGFDGFYTYFASNGFTYGSNRNHWDRINSYAFSHNMLFIPSVGPGYIDTRIRPWNKVNTKKRANGKYYEDSWNKALNLDTQLISITSFNEWHEGTQIEKAIPHVFGSYRYVDYKPYNPDYYLLMTKKFLNKFGKCKNYRRIS